MNIFYLADVIPLASATEKLDTLSSHPNRECLHCLYSSLSLKGITSTLTFLYMVSLIFMFFTPAKVQQIIEIAKYFNDFLSKYSEMFTI